MKADVLTQRHRAQQIVIQRDTVRRVTAAWPSLSYADLDGTLPDLAARVAPIVAANRRTSSAVASSYVRAIRAKHVRGDFTPSRAAVLGVDQFNASLTATTVAPIKAATSEGLAMDAALRNALVQVVGSMGRLVLSAGREVVTQSAIRDESARGWQRVGVGECDFCQLLLGRGAVYTEATADFPAHDHCSCSAEPVYG